MRQNELRARSDMYMSEECEGESEGEARPSHAMAGHYTTRVCWGPLGTAVLPRRLVVGRRPRWARDAMNHAAKLSSRYASMHVEGGDAEAAATPSTSRVGSTCNTPATWLTAAVAPLISVFGYL